MIFQKLTDFPLWTAMVTPFKEDGTIDFKSHEALLKEQALANNGALILGSTGEALNMSLEEKKSLLCATLDSIQKENLTLPLMVGVGGFDLEATKKWVSYLNSLKIDALLMVTPLYAKPESEGQFLWFKTLMDLSQHPVMLYNIPGRTGKSLSFETVSKLSKHPKFWGIKEASGQISDFQKYKKAIGDEGILMSGDDALLPAFQEYGCKGLVSVASNAWPKATKLYVKKTLANKLSPKDKSLWDACSRSLFCVSNPIPIKRLLAEEKRIETPFLKLPLSHKDLSQAVTLLEASLRISDWLKKEEDREENKE